MKKLYIGSVLGWLFCLGQVMAQSNAPSNLTGSAPDYNRVVLTWKDNSTNETKFEIERNNFASFTKIGEAGANTTTYTDNTAGGGTYRVRAVFATGATTYSNETTITTPQETPGVPISLVAALQGNSIKLTWNNSTTGGTPVNYFIDRSINGPGGSFTQIDIVPYSRTPTYTETNVSGGYQYCYRVRAQNPGGTSGYSNTACQTTPNSPSNVSNLKAQAISSSSITLTWNRFGKESGIGIERRTGQNGNWTQIANTLGDNGTYTDNGLTANTEYCYRISETSHDYSSTACATTPTSTPNAPARLTATATSSGQIDLMWADVSDNETGFELERSTDNANWTTIADIGANAMTYSNTGLSPSTRYFYRIRAKNAAGSSGYSNTADATTQAAPVTIPRPPGNLAASAASFSQINLTWTDNATDESGFELERSTDGTNFTKIQDVGANAVSLSDQGLQPRTRYYYRIRAKNPAGSSAYSNFADATTPDAPPAAPVRLMATATSPNQINLTWSDQSDNETGFQLEQSSDGANWTKIQDIPANQTTYSNAGLNPLTRYFYRIRAVNALGASGYSNIADATTQDKPLTPPAAPARLTATAVLATQINLTWADLSDNESGFEIERSPDSSTDWAKVGDAAANATSFQNTGLTPNKQYFYRVRAVNAAGQSAYSNVADATTPDVPPAAPVNLAITPASSTQINLTWADQSVNETGFEVERATSQTGTFTKLADFPANTTAYEDKGLSPAASYCYRVRTKNTVGTSDYSNVACDITPDVPPIAPVRLMATPVSPTQVNLAWADLSNNESGFDVERAAGSTGAFAKTTDLPANATTYEDKGLMDNTSYCYRVRAKNGAGTSAYTDVVCVTTPLAPPATPTNLTAQVSDYDQIRLNWSALGPTAATVIIERSTNPNSGFTEIRQQPAAQTSYVDVGLQEFTTYYYRIRAVNAAGNSDYSNVASARIEEIIIAVEDEFITRTTLVIHAQTLTISAKWQKIADASLRLLTLTGQEVIVDHRWVRPEDSWQYDLNALPTGVYIIQIVADGRTFAKRFLLP